MARGIRHRRVRDSTPCGAAGFRSAFRVELSNDRILGPQTVRMDGRRGVVDCACLGRCAVLRFVQRSLVRFVRWPLVRTLLRSVLRQRRVCPTRLLRPSGGLGIQWRRRFHGGLRLRQPLRPFLRLPTVLLSGIGVSPDLILAVRRQSLLRAMRAAMRSPDLRIAVWNAMRRLVRARLWDGVRASLRIGLPVWRRMCARVRGAWNVGDFWRRGWIVATDF
jgi:hypothetical protein